ncbi:hypothetical protein C2E23DRAFT_727672, partial [Lenzites betulinus]
MTTKEASISTNPKAPPTLGEGKITPAVLNAWDHGCMQYFRERSIEDSRQVLKASSGIANEVLRDWYLNDYERFDSLYWVEFLEEVCARFLPSGWASNIHAQIMGKRQGQDQSFDDFVLKVERLNSRLRGTPKRFSDTLLRDVLGANIVEDLRLTVEDDDVAVLTDYVLWKNAISAADKRRFRLREMMNQVVSARSSTFKGKNAQASSTSTTTKTSTTTSVARVPALTTDERNLLNAHRGCYKCRRFYQNHNSSTCPHGYPDAAKYITLTAAHATAAKGSKDAHSKSTVAAVIEEDDTACDTTIAAVYSSPAAATTSGILGTGSDSDDSEYVSPFFARHTILQATILSPSPSSPSASFPMLIDSGSPTVLIRADIVEQAGLRLRPLPTPYTLGNAWGSEQKESRHWVKLRLSLEDGSWDSVSCRAIVVSSLCSPIILGKPFLESNALVEDHATKQLIHKPSIHLRRLAHERYTHLGDYHTVCAVRSQVENLAMQSSLDEENCLLKSQFADCFPTDIPDTKDMPTDVYHRFVLKDPNLVIARRQYDCPKKYREAWR